MIVAACCIVAACLAARISNFILGEYLIRARGTLEKAASMANHASTRTTQLYDRRRDEMTLDEVERVVILIATSRIASALVLMGSS